MQPILLPALAAWTFLFDKLGFPIQENFELRIFLLKNNLVIYGLGQLNE